MAKVYSNGQELGGKVRVDCLLHIAGQGITYKARLLSDNTVVLVKQLNADPLTTNGQIAVKRFKREQSIAIESDHIPKVLGDLEHDGALFVITEFIDGRNLDELLRERGSPLSCEETRDILLQCAGALGAAHSKGIVHRDIKPANVMIAKDGTVYLVDWGLCRFMDAKTICSSSDPMGTIHFMSIEHIRNRGVDRQSDLYSLGVMGYLCLTLRYPFDGADEEEIFRNIVHDTPVPPQALNPDVDDDLNAIILKLIENEKAKRYSDTRALIADMDGGFDASLGGDRCKCGEPVAAGVTFCVRCGARRASTIAPRAGYLTILNGTRKGNKVEISPSGTEVGRRSLSPDDSFISRHHARIFFADGMFWIEDAGSVNGTLVNTLEIPRGGRHPLSSGDQVRLADTFCEFTV